MECPVPKNQIPSIEFHNLLNSWFFSLAIIENNRLSKALSLSFILVFPLIYIISNGSWTLHNDISKLLLVTTIFSLVAPLILLLRQIMAWNYVFRRLTAVNITYERSGWYDGATWQKPLEWRARDLLIAQQEVKPIKVVLQKALLINSSLIIFPIIIYQLQL